jgi:hypothetical protein
MKCRITRSDNSFAPTQEMASCLSRVNKHLAGGKASTVTLPSRLPEKGFGDVAALDLLGPLVLGGAKDLGSETFFAHMDPPMPWVTWVATFWNASVNQNLSPGHLPSRARSSSEIAVDAARRLDPSSLGDLSTI